MILQLRIEKKRIDIVYVNMYVNTPPQQQSHHLLVQKKLVV